MYKGGVKVDKRIDQTIRFTGLFVPTLLLVHGVLIGYDIIPSHNYAGFPALLAVTVPGMLLAAYQFLFWTSSRTKLFIYIALFHVYAGVYALLISGFNSPFSAAWVLLQMVSFTYFGMRGFRYSLMTFFIISVLDAFVLAIQSQPLELSLAALLTGVLVVAVSTGLVTIIRYISQPVSKEVDSQQRDELEANRLLTIVNNMADSFFNIDHTGRVLLYNAAALDLLDTNRTLTGLDIQEVLPLSTNDGQLIDVYDWLQKSRGLTIRDDVLLSLGDEERRIELTYSPVRSNQALGVEQSVTDYIILLRDVTKQKSLSEERDEFISVVSHELRTPLTVAEGTLSNLQLMLEQPKSKKTALVASAQQAHDQVMFLAKLVNDLSTLSRAERGLGSEVEKVSVRALVDELYNEYLAQAEQHTLTLDLDLSPRLGYVKTSRLYLKELLQNLLSNALKYTREGGITLKAHRQEGEICFEVIDTGIGISKTDQKKLFERFYRSEDYRTRETGGTGLGLYVVSKLARKLGVNVKVESRLNYGSTFSFTMPLDDEP